MAKISNGTLKAQCKRVADTKEWEADQWKAEDSAVCAIRTVLEEMGCKEELKDEHKETRRELVGILAPLFTAPINFRRTYLVEEGLAPKMPEPGKTTSKSADNA